MAALELLLVAVMLAAVVFLLVQHLRQLQSPISGLTSLSTIRSLLRGFGGTPAKVPSTANELWDDHHAKLRRIGVFGVTGVFVSDPDHLQELFTRKDLVNKDRFVYKFFNAIGRGLVSLNGAVWRAHRRAFQPAFHHSLLDSFTSVFSAEALGYARRIRPGEAQDVKDNLQSMVVRNFFWTAIASADLSEDEVESMLPDVKAMVNTIAHSMGYRMVRPWLWPDWIFFYLTARGRHIRRLTAKVNAYCNSIFATRRVKLNQKGATSHDSLPADKYRTLLDVLLEPGHEQLLSDEEILDEFKTLFGAAVDTSVCAMSWVLKALSLRQDVQERLLQEVEEVFGKNGTSDSHIITTADLARLEYTECVLKEAMRLLPTVPLISREVMQETEFCGQSLPAGTKLFVNILGAHRDPPHWPDPLRFDPDRFLPENCQGRHPYAYIPFSAGPRNCIGGRYAMMVMKTMLATLVPRYRIDPVDDGYKEPADLPMVGIFSKMRGGTRVVFTPRAGSMA